MFSIIGLEDKNKIAALGNLSQNPDMERIIMLGQNAVTSENENQRDWGFKKEIGVYIEDMVKNEIADQVKSFEIILQSQQGGQDMIAKLNGEIVYFIEVKSQWENNESVTLSYAQSQRSVHEQEQYALCVVDLVNHRPTDEDRFKPSREIVCENARFVATIGKSVEELIEAAVIAEIDGHDVRMADEYRVKVFQNIIETEGKPFDSFINYFIKELRSKHSDAFTKC